MIRNDVALGELDNHGLRRVLDDADADDVHPDEIARELQRVERIIDSLVTTGTDPGYWYEREHMLLSAGER
jgi:hypothetical protein